VIMYDSIFNDYPQFGIKGITGFAPLSRGGAKAIAQWQGCVIRHV
jgi:hypothetical protein